MSGDRNTPGYQKALIALAEKRKDCVSILATPYEEEDKSSYLNSIVNYRKYTLNANTSYAALYTPHVLIQDKYNDRQIYVSPDGFVGAIISATAANSEIWYPPAGWRRGVMDVLDVRRRFTEGEMDYLYDNGINPIRFAAGRGIVVWGQKTLSTRPSALDRLNVRLMLIVVEPAIKAALEDFIFELNDATTRLQITSIIDSAMAQVKASGGVYDYMVKVDAENNTPQDIDNYEMKVWLFLKPVKDVEFIEFSPIITTTGADFTLAAQSLLNAA